MSQLPTLIADLALILICAGVMTLLFKKLKQPLVLGYVVAGFLASPHMLPILRHGQILVSFSCCLLSVWNLVLRRLSRWVVLLS